MLKELTYYDRKHLALMTVQEKRINAIFNQFVRLISPELRKWNQTNSGIWVRNSKVENAIDKHLLELRSALEKEIRTNQSYAWTNSNEKNDKLIELFIQNIPIASSVKKGMFVRNLDALKSLQNRIDKGLNLSQRVWNITTQTKGHIELFLESGIATGRSAEAIGRDLRQLLNNPNKRFRRVRDENGKLQLSQPMKDYHPGQGVYRSSRMNALRVSATETNMAYRVSDVERWKKLDFVLGYEVRRSANSVPCAICDPLTGKYPKSFNFSSFHPFCKCHAVPIVMNHDDFAEFLLYDKIPADKYIKDIPKSAKKFLAGNQSYLKSSYFGKIAKSFINF